MFLAKSNPEESIKKHTDNLLQNYDILKKIYGEEIDINWSILKLACLYHDVGKINNAFQNKLKRTQKKVEIKEIPHGYLSATFIDIDSLIDKYTEEEVCILVTAVAKHHIRKFEIEDMREEIRKEVESLKEVSKEFKSEFSYDEIPNISEYIDEYSLEALYNNELSGFSKEEDKINYILVKGLLNRIDYAASGYYQIEYKNDFLTEALNEYKKSWGKNADFNDLQKYMQDSQDENVIVVAETGYGKTEAGLLWIGNNKGIFTLPIRAAINSIYDRIRNEILKENNNNLSYKLALLHSDSLSELFKRVEAEEDKLKLEDLEILDYNDRARQKSLPLTVSTLDQIFKFVYKYQGFEQDLATLSYSKIVIDEIQMYSPDLLAYLIVGLDMITKIGGKFAIITATLPPFIVDLLRKRNIEFKEPINKYTKKNRIRHEIKLLKEQLNFEFVREQFQDNKVLVITNTVRKAQEIYDGLKDELEEKINIFHGSYIKKDRKSKEDQIIKFGDKNNKDTGIWICTQVAEASLDIDFDILVTELSDLNGLFQRMGRCYRNRNLEEGKTNIFVFDGGDELCTGIGFVNDKGIFEFSKNELREEFKNRETWRISELEKLDLIEKVYSTEKMNSTDYYREVEDTIKYLDSTFIYEKSKSEVSKVFRAIDNIDIIPSEVYKENEIEIKKNIEIIKRKYTDKKDLKTTEKERLEKIKARIAINDLTVSIPYYFSNYDNTYREEINDYESISIYECEYDKKDGLRHIKEKVKKEYEEDIVNII
ncbi:CRISPR-associated helicase, Cas3 family [Anaerosphaera aminiphila DSM 21120]|uniref:CRISPR-associated helicase, Cas3 family n=1 Tax=Anaerosphaera aminiphila DSM 21120 TaxID=1120995 RepID=A0A1M5U4Y4_9FIRM|nr:CRISPR-associated helicase/endonuclease Cas3 [Anaerosphaera aminiphila]SHH57998.1 CRISPR-associated helicase, Cas3 family [Anaerosphaera aminiphila DSM 21120]